jgi:spore coat protein U-like protein
MSLKSSFNATAVAVGVMAALGVVGTAAAGTTTSSITVSATVANNCAISTTTQLVFGAYDPIVANLSSPLNATANPAVLTMACTSGDNVVLALSVGANGTGAGTGTITRAMKNGLNSLSYALYQDSGLNTAWGDDPGTNTLAISADGTSHPYNVYGQVPANQNVPAGTYQDTVVATVTF